MAADLEEAILALRQYFRQPELTSPTATDESQITLTAQLIRFIFGSNLGSMGIADMQKAMQSLNDFGADTAGARRYPRGGQGPAGCGRRRGAA